MSTDPIRQFAGRDSQRARVQPQAQDLAAVHVELPAVKGKRRSLGSAAQALQNRSLTQAERSAILALVEAIRLLRERAGLAGIDDAGLAVRLLLRDADANQGGPWATTGAIAVGSVNALAVRSGSRARTDVLLTVDCAVHELAHVVQFQRMNTNAKPNGAILEGVADAAAILATGDDTLGEEFFTRDANGRWRGSIRELGKAKTSGPAVGRVVTDYREVLRGGVEDHAAGGVVSAVFRSLRAQLGRGVAEQLLWAVIRDQYAWQNGGSWSDLVSALKRQAKVSNDSRTTAAVEQALRITNLNIAEAA